MEHLLVLTWRSHPARENPARFAVAVAVLAGASIAALFFSGSLMVAVAMLLAVWGATYEFFVPTDYRVDADGVTISRPARRARHRRWADFRRVARERHGLLLSPFRTRIRFLDERRGIYLRYSDNAAEVRSVVTAFLQARNPKALA